MSGFSSLEQVAQILQARWRLIALTAGLVFAAFAGGTALVRPAYTASVDIIFNTRATDPIDKSDSLTFNNYVSSEVELITSRRILGRLGHDPAFLARPATQAQLARHRRGAAPAGDWLSEFIAARVDVTTAKNSRTGTIAATFDDPVFAADVANGVARAYLATNVDLRVSPARQNVAFFRSQKAARAAELATAQAALSAFLRDTGMTGLESKSDADELQLRTLGEKLTQAQAELAGTAAEGSVGDAGAAVSAGTISNAVLQGLRADIAGQVAALKDLTVLRGPNHPAVVQANARLTELEGQYGAEAAKIETGLRRRSNAVAREGASIGALERNKRASLSASAANRARLAVLQADVERASLSFDTVAAKLAEGEMASALEQPNASILSPALPPRRPSTPNWPLSLVFGGLAGLVAGLLAALAAELIAPRVRSGRDLESALGAPVLCDMAA